MVQRMVPNPNKLKLGIQADHSKSDKRLGGLKPSSYHHQDGKNKGTDLKKKMKKSRSIKLCDIHGLRSSPVPVIKTINAPPGKPPPLNVPAAAAATIPQKKYVIKPMDGSPNYMKSTSSSEAKKEISLVSSWNPQTGIDGKNLGSRSSTGSKISSGSCNKHARTLTRTSSLKLVTTLTKSPSFKPAKFHDGDKQECVSSIVVDHAMFEVIDMDWEEWRFSTSDPDDETHSSLETDDQSDMNIGDSYESDGNNLHTDESHGNLAEETLTAGVEQEVFEEDVAFIDTCSQVSETICYDQASSAEEMFQMLVAMDEEEEEENAEIYSMGIVTNPSSTEELHEGPGPISGKENSLEDGTPITSNDVPKNGCITDVKDESQDETNEDYNVILRPSDSEVDPTVAISDSCPEKELQSGVPRDSMEARGVADAESMIEVNCAIDGCFPTQAIATGDESLFAESQDHLSDNQHEKTNVVESESIEEEDEDEAVFKATTCMDSQSEEQICSMMHKTSLAAQGNEEIGEMEMEDNTTSIGLDGAEILQEKSDKTSREDRRTFSRSNAKEELPDDHSNRKWTIGRRRHEENNNEEPRKFNPREPNFLPVVPEPDAEKVDLRHQMMDERKNPEEWMLDHALQQPVSTLAPARKRKVELLVEAFETVLPINTCETRLRHTSTGFAHGRPIQACN